MHEFVSHYIPVYTARLNYKKVIPDDVKVQAKHDWMRIIVQGECSVTQRDNNQDAFRPPLWCIHSKYQFLVFFINFS